MDTLHQNKIKHFFSALTNGLSVSTKGSSFEICGLIAQDEKGEYCIITQNNLNKELLQNMMQKIFNN
jgi:hypothetical protein